MSTSYAKPMLNVATVASEKESEPRYTVAEVLEIIKSNPDWDTTLEVLEHWVLRRSNEYSHIDFEAELKRLRNLGTPEEQARYKMLEMLLQGYAQTEGKVWADPKLVGPTLRKRLEELQRFQAMRWYQKIPAIISRKLKLVFARDTIEEYAQKIAEVQAADEKIWSAAEIKANANIEVNELKSKASDECLRKYEEADRYSAGTKRAADNEARDIRRKAAEDAAEQTRNQKDMLTELSLEIGRLEAVKRSLLADPEIACRVEITNNSEDKKEKAIQEFHESAEKFWTETRNTKFKSNNDGNALDINKTIVIAIHFAFYNLILVPMQKLIKMGINVDHELNKILSSIRIHPHLMFSWRVQKIENDKDNEAKYASLGFGSLRNSLKLIIAYPEKIQLISQAFKEKFEPFWTEPWAADVEEFEKAQTRFSKLMETISIPISDGGLLLVPSEEGLKKVMAEVKKREVDNLTSEDTNPHLLAARIFEGDPSDPRPEHERGTNSTGPGGPSRRERQTLPHVVIDA